MRARVRGFCMAALAIGSESTDTRPPGVWPTVRRRTQWGHIHTSCVSSLTTGSAWCGASWCAGPKIAVGPWPPAAVGNTRENRGTSPAMVASGRAAARSGDECDSPACCRCCSSDLSRLPVPPAFLRPRGNRASGQPARLACRDPDPAPFSWGRPPVTGASSASIRAPYGHRLVPTFAASVAHRPRTLDGPALLAYAATPLANRSGERSARR